MYFWKIHKLKIELASSPLGSLEGLQYILAIVVVSTAQEYLLGPPDPRPFNTWDHVGSSGMFVISVVGAISCFLANGGRSGPDFLSRFLSLGWVLGIRFVVLALVPMMIAVFILEDFRGEVPTETSLLRVSGTLVVLALFFFRLRHHFLSLDRGQWP